MGTLTRLSHFALNKKNVPDFVRPSTAIGQRLLDISRLFDEGVLSDDQVHFYLEELMTVCEHQFLVFEQHEDYQGIAQKVVSYLDSILDLIEEFDARDHSQLSQDVSKLEWELTQVAVSLSCAEAA